MSRKRKKQPEGVPHEVLAEGSGPSSVDQLAEAAADILDLEAQLDDIEADDHDALEAHVVEVLERADDHEEMVFDPSDADASAEAMRAEAEADLGDAIEEPDDAADDDDLGAALPTTAASMDDRQLKSLVEALVFASDKPITLQRLRQLTRISDTRRLEQVLSELATEYADRGVSLQQVSGGYLFRTNTQYSVWVQQLIAGRPVRLSRAQLETLAIIAYRQPITRPEVDEIRGVDSSATLRLLMDRSLIRILGRKEEVGRPILYGTTKEFLDFFSLGDLRELPTLREYSELTAESRKLMTDELGGEVMSRHMAEARAANDIGMEVALDGAPRSAHSWARSGEVVDTHSAVHDVQIEDVDMASAVRDAQIEDVDVEMAPAMHDVQIEDVDVEMAPAMRSTTEVQTDDVAMAPAMRSTTDVQTDDVDMAPAMQPVDSDNLIDNDAETDEIAMQSVETDNIDIAAAMQSGETGNIDMPPADSHNLIDNDAETGDEIAMQSVEIDNINMPPAMQSVETDNIDMPPAMQSVDDDMNAVEHEMGAPLQSLDSGEQNTDDMAPAMELVDSRMQSKSIDDDLNAEVAQRDDDAAKEPPTD